MTAPKHATPRPVEHAHRWRFEEAHGPTSVGTCSVCGEQRIGRNYLAEFDFQYRDAKELQAYRW